MYISPSKCPSCTMQRILGLHFLAKKHNRLLSQYKFSCDRTFLAHGSFYSGRAHSWQEYSQTNHLSKPKSSHVQTLQYFKTHGRIFITQETLERQAGNGSISTTVLLLVDIMYSVVGQLGMSRLLNVQNSRLRQILNMLPP